MKKYTELLQNKDNKRFIYTDNNNINYDIEINISEEYPTIYFEDIENDREGYIIGYDAIIFMDKIDLNKLEEI